MQVLCHSVTALICPIAFFTFATLRPFALYLRGYIRAFEVVGFAGSEFFYFVSSCWVNLGFAASSRHPLGQSTSIPFLNSLAGLGLLESLSVYTVSLKLSSFCLVHGASVHGYHVGQKTLLKRVTNCKPSSI